MLLNGEKTIEIRKKFPKDYVGWVYIYCTKGNKHECLEYADNPNPNKEGKWIITSGYPYANGKVVARFNATVEHIEYETCSRDISGWWKDDGKMYDHKVACLNYKEMFDYIGAGEGTDIHINELEIFDKPKEIKEFSVYSHSIVGIDIQGKTTSFEILKPLPCAPQSWCYIYE